MVVVYVHKHEFKSIFTEWRHMILAPFLGSFAVFTISYCVLFSDQHCVFALLPTGCLRCCLLPSASSLLLLVSVLNCTSGYVLS